MSLQKKNIMMMSALIALVLFNFRAFSYACDTWVAVGNATADGSVILAKSSDRGAIEAQPFQYVPRTKHFEKDVKCTHISIPQVEETYAYMGSRPWWTFGYEMGMNEWAVAIGNEAVFTKEPYAETGLLGMDLIRLALERAKTAYEAMHIIIDLIGKYGQGGNCVHKDSTGEYFTYHNSFIIADPNGAWVLETAGKYWAAKKVKDVWVISNLPSIESDFDEAHPELISHAIEKGWCKSEKDFNFTRAYTDFASHNQGRAQIRANANLYLLKEKQGKVTVKDMMRINRSHNEGTIVAPRWSPNETLFDQACQHEYPPFRPGRSAASMVAHLRKDRPDMLRQVYWHSFSTPCVNVFKPFYFAGNTVPEQYSVGTYEYSPDSPWWWAEKTKRLCDLNYAKLAPVVQVAFSKIEQKEFAEAAQVEKNALMLIKKGEENKAESLLQQFCSENCKEIEKQYKELDEALTRMIPAAGVDYLFLDNLKKNCSINKLRLPMPEE